MRSLNESARSIHAFKDDKKLGSVINKRMLIIFDLDGTLIDSSIGILSALKKAFDLCGVTPAGPLTKEIVGPPLDEMLKIVTHLTDREKLKELKEAFKSIYDHSECTNAVAFPGIEEMLTELVKKNYLMALATNKRLFPTIRILEAKGWQKYFRWIETADSNPGGLQSKAQMIRNIMSYGDGALLPLYLGDTHHDSAAAEESGVPCVIVEWGYKKSEVSNSIAVINNPMQLFSIVDFIYKPLKDTQVLE